MEALDPREHVEVSGRVLFDDVLHVVRSKGLLELPTSNKELNLSEAADDPLVDLHQLGHALCLVKVVCTGKLIG